MAPPAERDGEGFSDSDQAWWDAVRGRAEGRGAGSDAAREGELLRRALQQADQHDAGPAPDGRDQRWQRARARLQAEGLIAAPATPPAPRAWQRAGWGAALAAGLFAAFVLVQRPSVDPAVYGEPPVMRSTETELVTVPSDRPRADAEALAATLRDSGWKAALYQKGATFYVDTLVAFDTPPPARAALAALGVRSSAGGVRLAFAPR